MSQPSPNRPSSNRILALAVGTLLSACGGGSSPPSNAITTSGFAVDGYLSGATVTCDSNGNGVADSGETSVTTNSSGGYSFVGGCSAPLLLTGGTSIDTGLDFDGQLKAPAGAKVITPLTTLMAEGMTQAQVISAFGLPSDTDLLNTDPAYAPTGTLVNGTLMKVTAATQLSMQKLTETFIELGGLTVDATPAQRQAVYAVVTKAIVGFLNSHAAAKLVQEGAASLDATVLAGIISAAATEVANSSASDIPDAVKTALAGINSTGLGLVVAGGLTAQMTTLLTSGSSTILSSVTELMQEDTRIAAFVFANRATLANNAESLASDLSEQISLPTAASSPTRAAANVYSIYSDSYTRVTAPFKTVSIDLNPNWGQATAVSEVTIGGNKTLKLAGLTYQGIDFSGLPLNVTSLNSLHLDVWSVDVTKLDVYIISAGNEKAVTRTLSAGWTSIDIPLTSYTGPDQSKIIQIKLVANTPASGTIYLDNLYFWGTSAAPTPSLPGAISPPSSAAPTPTEQAENVLSVYSGAYTPITGVTLNPDWGQNTAVSEVTIGDNDTLKLAGLDYQGIDWYSNPIDVSSYSHLHVDVWSDDVTKLDVYIISAGKENAVSNPLTPNSWNSIDIPLSSYTVPDKSKIIQIKFVSNTPTSGNVFMDNLYFSK